jgi:hypothetical protein
MEEVRNVTSASTVALKGRNLMNNIYSHFPMAEPGVECKFAELNTCVFTHCAKHI